MACVGLFKQRHYHTCPSCHCSSQVFTYFNVDACVEEEVRPGIMLSKAVCA